MSRQQTTLHFEVPTPGVGVPFCTNPDHSLPNCDSRIYERSSAPTWLVDLDYVPVQDVLLYGKYARGYRAGGIKKQGMRTTEGKLYAVDCMLNDRLVIVFQNAVDAGGQPAAADFVPWMRGLVEPEHRQADSTQLVGGGGSGRPHAYHKRVIHFHVWKYEHGAGFACQF